ncbi:MAG TPA: hypothetical protein VFZ16_21770 [Hyphomicrobiaceae bacterium]|nr:hypothetical protein [Hyphomicrobiaceae bacterium]
MCIGTVRVWSNDPTQHQAEQRVHSDLIAVIASWLPDMFAFLGTALQSDAAKEDSRKAAVAHEGDVAIEIFSLLPVGLK